MHVQEGIPRASFYEPKWRQRRGAVIRLGDVRLHRLPQRFTGTLSGARAVAQGTKITHTTVGTTRADHAWRQVFAITKGCDVVAPNRFVAKMTCELDVWVPAAAYSHSVRVQMSIPTGEVDDVNAVNLATASCTSQFSAEQNFRVAEKFAERASNPH